MCTLTVQRGENALLVTMNRDELMSRAPELPPRDHGTWLGPQDGERLGTWCGVNRQGVVGCLLNDYPETDDEPALPPPRSGPSRGDLIPQLLTQPDPASVRAALQALDLSAYPAFMLFIGHPDGGWMAVWRDRLRFTPLPEGWSMWTSSGWRSRSVGHWRKDRFQAWLARQELTAGVPAFNLLSVPGEEWSSPLAARGVSGTRSVTQVAVADGNICLRYWPGPHWPPAKPASEVSLPVEGGPHTAAKPSD